MTNEINKHKVQQIFINLPVADLEKSMNFYTAMGFTINPLFTGNNQICMACSEEILVMLQSKEFFNAGSAKQIADSKKAISASFTLPVVSINRMNEVADKAVSAGGKETLPLIDKGFMQVRTIEDIDGHTWGIIYLDLEKFNETKAKRN